MEKSKKVKQQSECFLKDEFCEIKECRYSVDWVEVGNCVLRVDREHTLEEIGIAFGITRERARQVVDLALKKCWVEMTRREWMKPKYRKSPPHTFTASKK